MKINVEFDFEVSPGMDVSKDYFLITLKDFLLKGHHVMLVGGKSLGEIKGIKLLKSKGC